MIAGVRPGLRGERMRLVTSKYRDIPMLRQRIADIEGKLRGSTPSTPPPSAE